MADSPVRLAEAADQALDELGDGSQIQEALVPTCKIRFVGTNFDSMDDPPDIRSEVEFIVQGLVVGSGDEVMADGGERKVVKVKVTSIKPV